MGNSGASSTETEPAALEMLGRALAQTQGLLAAVGPAQLSWPTPCGHWDVGTLLGHVVRADLANFLARAQNRSPDWGAAPLRMEAGWVEEFRTGARELAAAWAAVPAGAESAGPGGAAVPLISAADQQIAELAAHGWDLARATGQHPELDEAVGEYALAWAKRSLRPEHRGPEKAFGAEVPVPDQAGVYERLAGWFGRDPGWEPTPPG
jgi:uncharacterized protein (TIGR03086 family)